MPRKGSSKQSLKNVARWLEWRCGQKWQYVVVPKQNNLAPDLAADLARFYTPGEHEIRGRQTPFFYSGARQ
jgi:hypothetical protein